MGRTTKDYEGFRDSIYKDTKGKRTVGYGFNIDDPVTAKMVHPDVVSGRRKMSREEAEPVYHKRMGLAKSDAKKYLGKTYDSLDDSAREAVHDMSYNMGHDKLSKFKGMKAALDKGDYGRAADEVEYSDANTKKQRTPYYQQTGDRAKENVERFRTAKARKEIGGQMVKNLTR